MKGVRAASDFLKSNNTSIEWSALIVIFALAAWYRIKCPGIPISDPDTWGYLYPGLSDLAGSGFQQTHGRGIAYPLFIKWILQSTESFFAIPAIQHIMGVLSGLIWWLIWKEWVKWLPANWRNTLGINIVGLLFLALYLWNANAITSEEMIRPEGIFPLLSLMQTFLCISYARLRWKEDSLFGSCITGALAVLMGFICISAKPSWGFAGLVPIVFTLAGSIAPLRLARLPSRILPLALGCALVFVWLDCIPKWTRWIIDSSSRTFLPSTLVTIHAPIVSKFLHSEADKGKLNDTEMSFLNNWDRRLEESKNLTRTSYSILGYDPDYLMYHSDALDLIRNSKTTEEFRTFLLRIYIHSALSYPNLIFVKVGNQVLVAFGDLSKSLYQNERNICNNLERSIKSMDYYALPLVGTNIETSYQEVRNKTVNFISKGSSSLKFGPSIHNFLLRGLGPVILGIIMLAWIPALAYYTLKNAHGKNSDFTNALKIFSILWTTSIGTILSVAIVHSFDIDRYLYLLSPQYSILLAAGISFLTTWILTNNKFSFK